MTSLHMQVLMVSINLSKPLKNLYGINIDYYVKINFAGSQAVIDASVVLQLNQR